MRFLLCTVALVTIIGEPLGSRATDVGVARTKNGYVIGTNDVVSNTDTGKRIGETCKLRPVKNGVILFQMNAFSIPVAHNGKLVMKFDFSKDMQLALNGVSGNADQLQEVVTESILSTIKRGFAVMRRIGAGSEIPNNAAKISRFSTMNLVIVGWELKGAFVRTVEIEVVDAVRGTLKVTPYPSELKVGEMLDWNGYVSPRLSLGSLDEKTAVLAMTKSFDTFRIAHSAEVHQVFDPPYSFAFVGGDGSKRLLSSQSCSAW